MGAKEILCAWLKVTSLATKTSSSLKPLSSTLILNLTFIIINRFPILVHIFTLLRHTLLQLQGWCIQNNEQNRRCRTEVATAVAVVEEEDTQMGTIIIQATIPVEIDEVETILHCSSGYDYPRSRTCSLSRPRSIFQCAPSAFAVPCVVTKCLRQLATCYHLLIRFGCLVTQTDTLEVAVTAIRTASPTEAATVVRLMATVEEAATEEGGQALAVQVATRCRILALI